MSIIEENDWVRDGDTTIFRKSIPFNSHLGQRVLNDLSIRYPQFKPKYIDQLREYEGAPFYMVVASLISPEDAILTILDENNLPRTQEYLKDIASVTYRLADDVLEFGKMFTYYDVSKLKEAEIRPDLREFYRFYQSLQLSAPQIASLIELFALRYEKQLEEYNRVYEPYALRELLWKFGNALLGN